MKNTATITPASPLSGGDSKYYPIPSLEGSPTYALSLLKVQSVSELVGLAKPTIYKMMAAGKFPLPVTRTGRHVAWRAADVEAWLAELKPAPLALNEGAVAWRPRQGTGKVA